MRPVPFPLPIDPDFRKEVITSWIDDVDDRLEIDDLDGAHYSWKVANTLYISLPAGQGDFLLEESLVQARVKIDKHYHTKTKCDQ